VAAGFEPRSEHTLVGRVYNLILNDFDRAVIETLAKKNPGFEPGQWVDAAGKS